MNYRHKYDLLTRNNLVISPDLFSSDTLPKKAVTASQELGCVLLVLGTGFLAVVIVECGKETKSATTGNA